MNKRFNIYTSHLIAQTNGCFQCCRHLTDITPKLSDYPDGKYQLRCPGCGASNWYDIEDKIIKHPITKDIETRSY